MNGFLGIKVRFRGYSLFSLTKMLNVDVNLNKSVVDRVGPFSDKIVILFCEKKKKNEKL